VRSHPEVRKKPGGGSAAKEPVRLETDSVRTQAEARQKVRACRPDEVDQAVRTGDRAFQKPHEGVWKPQILDVNPVAGRGEVRSRRNAGTATRIDLAVGLEGAGQDKITVAGKPLSERRAEVGQSAMVVLRAQQKLARAQRSRRQNKPPSHHGARLGALGIRGIESSERNSVPASIQLDFVDAMQGVNLRAMLLGQRKVVEVQRVLGMQNAAQHAIARIVAGT